MTQSEALRLARMISQELPHDYQIRLKAIHVIPKLHSGVTTIRVFCTNQPGAEPDPYLFNAEDLG